jgi:hypothetical protein
VTRVPRGHVSSGEPGAYGVRVPGGGEDTGSGLLRIG